MEVGLRLHADRRGRAPGPGRPACAPDARRRTGAARPRSLARAARCRAGRRDRLGSDDLPHPYAARRRLPAAARGRRGCGHQRAGGCLRRDDRKGRPVGLARRDAADPDRDPRLRLGLGAAHGRDRLLPAQRQGDRPRRAAASARSRPTSRPARSRSSSRIAGQTALETLTVSPRQNQIVFSFDGVVLSSRLIDGQFPNYRQLLPERSEHELRLARQELTDVVRRVSLLAQKNAPLRLAFAPGEVTVSAQTPDVGEAQRDAPRAVSGRGLRDRLQSRVPARRARERRVATS